MTIAVAAYPKPPQTGPTWLPTRTPVRVRRRLFPCGSFIKKVVRGAVWSDPVSRHLRLFHPDLQAIRAENRQTP